MALYFNTAGPCIAGEHYMVPPTQRFSHVMRLIEERKFFTIHAGRQTGKTTSARWLVDHYNSGSEINALWVDIQPAREQSDPAKAFRTILRKFDMALELDLPELSRPEHGPLLEDPSTAILRYLAEISAGSPLPLVVLVDEADGLVGESMVSFLTQLRDGYIARSKRPFPSSLALIGMRQVRDYVISSDERNAVTWLGTTSPFNITAEAATLRPFTEEEVSDLLGQHTEQTGQRFEPDAVARIYWLSQGHPWLVNALADQAVNRDVEDPSIAVTKEHIDAAKETIILERKTHVDSLVARLREPRVRRIIAPMLAGETTSNDVLDDDFAYVLDLGLLTRRSGKYEVANPIYREVIPRALIYVRQGQIDHEPSWYVTESDGLDMPKLMAAWQKFWRRDGHLAAAGFHYREAGPHLMLMAFLQRIVNGGGRVEREYGLGRGALDLLILWKDERYIVEVKLRRDTDTEAETFEQVLRYMDTYGQDEAWLLLFDLRRELTWEKRLYQRDEHVEGQTIHVVGC